MILEPREIKSATVSTVSPSICHEVMGPDVMIYVFWMLSFKPTFSLSSFTFIKRLFSSSSLSAIRVVSSAYLRLLKSLQLWPNLCSLVHCSPVGSSVHGILQARILKWVGMPSSRGSPQPRDRTHISYLLHLQAGSLPLAPPGNLYAWDIFLIYPYFQMVICLNRFSVYSIFSSVLKK